ncbi:hypothetical protein K3495_g1701 [Podosphaera aphanis]|nr:hypothetical protein K3495_g1701 [Podosphaera aphanis]
MSVKQPRKASAIFVHAGAGFHSVQNEKAHLKACNSAAKAAMRILRAGGTAVDAVEAAIKALEDREITNAGFGSNLAIDGVVECDATVVDHLGRSGACGATAQIKNPINLARKILDASNEPLSFNRISPNLLVGQGAIEFAKEHGIPVIPHEQLISKNARNRYISWQDCFKSFGDQIVSGSCSKKQTGDELKLKIESCTKGKQHCVNDTLQKSQELCPDTPPVIPADRRPYDQKVSSKLKSSPSPVSRSHYYDSSPNELPAKRARLSYAKKRCESHERSISAPTAAEDKLAKKQADIEITESETFPQQLKNSNTDFRLEIETQSTYPRLHMPRCSLQHRAVSSTKSSELIDDLITDTVGAIAIDIFGHIAAGSSSGGIGMKRRGRVGPAGLVGIGSAVVPIDKADENEVCVAAVTSGTGEHMATTMASQKCADRLYHNTKRTKGGADIKATEEEAMESFIETDFMAHPGVCASNSVGAIGAMAVKITRYGYFFYFAHNTDSFALASMHSSEKSPRCVMSRLGKFRNIVSGAQKIQIN